MSDPVENVEIEDVLSSIRRLVSADDREDRSARSMRAPESEATAQPVNAESDEDSKLVLTPALRVDNDQPNAEAEEREPHEEDAEEPQVAFSHHQEQVAEGEVIEEDKAAFGGEEDDADGWDEIEDAEFVDVTEPEEKAGEPEVQSAQHDELPQFLRRSDINTDRAPEPSVDEDAATEEEQHTLQDVAGYDEPAEDEGTPDTDAALNEIEELQSRIEKMGAAFDEFDEPYDPEPGSGDANAPEEADKPLPWAEMDAAKADGGQSDEATAEAAETEDAEFTEPEPEAATLHEAHVEDAEILESDAEDAAFEDAEEADEVVLSALDPNPDEAEREQPASPEDFLEEDAVIDEDMLRDMVAEIVRQELQGALGERITRNVRKLVRREINRALMSQGID